MVVINDIKNHLQYPPVRAKLNRLIAQKRISIDIKPNGSFYLLTLAR